MQKLTISSDGGTVNVLLKQGKTADVATLASQEPDALVTPNSKAHIELHPGECLVIQYDPEAPAEEPVPEGGVQVGGAAP